MSKRKPAEENVISDLYNYIKSRGFLEHIRLECIADVKKKPTYLKLKERVNDYLLNKWSNKDCKVETNPIELSTCREQIVECCVLAITIENVIDLVVSQRLKEVIHPMLQEFIDEHSSKTKRGKPQLNKSYMNQKVALTRTTKLVREKCDTTEIETKKMLENGIIGQTLASVTFPKTEDTDDDRFSVSVSSVRTSDLSSFNSDLCMSSDEEDAKVLDGKLKAAKNKTKSANKRKEKSFQQNRSQRERKQNPKYSSSNFNADCNSAQTKDTTTSIPQGEIKKELHPIPNVYCNGYSKHSSTDSSAPVEKHSNSAEDKTLQDEHIKRPKSNSSHSTTMEKMSIDQSSEAGMQPVVLITPLNSTEDSIRKSGRKRKLNSRIFSDSMSPYLAMMNPKTSQLADIDIDLEEFRKTQVPEPPMKTENKNHNELNKTLSTSKMKRYDSSDLYKPHYGSSNRAKRT